MKIVVDTNIYLSAFVFPGGTTERVLEFVRDGRAQLFVSPEILTEFQHVLIRKFKYPEKTAKEFVERVTAIAELVYPKERLAVIKACPPDNRILECALEAKANYLITGDKKHILPVKKIKETIILSPSAFCQLIEQ
jgi:putative PIN family toxin of toxin-antitoxin system